MTNLLWATEDHDLETTHQYSWLQAFGLLCLGLCLIATAVVLLGFTAVVVHSLAHHAAATGGGG